MMTLPVDLCAISRRAWVTRPNPKFNHFVPGCYMYTGTGVRAFILDDQRSPRVHYPL